MSWLGDIIREVEQEQRLQKLAAVVAANPEKYGPGASRLEKENATLKKLLAEKELEGHLKDELLKKKYAWARKKS